LIDMRDAVSGIQDATASLSYDAFANSWIMQRAVERGLEIISEASQHIPDGLRAIVPQIPWRQIAAIGNLLRHEYQRADILATWNLIDRHLLPLATAIEQLITDVERGQKG